MAFLATTVDELELTLQLIAEICLGNRSDHAQYVSFLTTAADNSSPLLWGSYELSVRIAAFSTTCLRSAI